MKQNFEALQMIKIVDGQKIGELRAANEVVHCFEKSLVRQIMS